MTSINRFLPRTAFDKTSRAAFLVASALGSAALLEPRLARAAPAPGLIIRGKGDWLFPAWESLTDAGTSGIAAVITTVDATRKLLHDAGIETLVTVVPMKARFFADRLPDGVALSPAVAARYKAILAALDAAGIASLDVDAVMRTVTEPAFFRTDYHWTEWSAEAVAQACAKKLQSMVSLPPSATALPPLSAFSQDQHMGDLAELLPADVQKAIGPESITIRVIDASRAQLLDSSKSIVHVVGNSFSMPYLGFPEMLAETLAQPVGVTAKFGNAGPWQTMIQYLESTAFRAKKPRAIVWQFVEGLFMHGPAATGFWDVTSLMSDQTFLARAGKAVTSVS